jgi:hypothetical protein
VYRKHSGRVSLLTSKSVEFKPRGNLGTVLVDRLPKHKEAGPAGLTV